MQKIGPGLASRLAKACDRLNTQTGFCVFELSASKMRELPTQIPVRMATASLQFTIMSFGSGLFFLTKIGLLYLSEQIGLPAWWSYLIINATLTIVAWIYHSRVTFKTTLNVRTARRFIWATSGLMLVDYLGFLGLTYLAHIHPVVSAIIMSGIQFGLRFVTYSTYVFRKGNPMVGRVTLSKVLLGIALLIGSLNYTLAIKETAPHRDGKQIYCSAANLYVFGVFSSDCSGSGAPSPSMKREPGTSVLLALTFALAGAGGDARVCVESGPEWCKKLRMQQRIFLLLPFLALILLVNFAAYEVTGKPNLAVAAALCTAFGQGLIIYAQAFYAELLAALLLLLTAWMLYRVARQRHLFVSSVVCGVALGLLALTQAVYFYFVPVVGVLALALFALRARRRAGAGALVAVLIAAMIGGIWTYRNHVYFGSSMISGRSGTVMWLRAEYTTMTWPQYWTGYLATIPKVGPKLASLVDRDPDDVAMFDRHNGEGFYQRGKAFKASDETKRRQALRMFVDNWPVQIALVPLSIYWSAFLPPLEHMSLDGRWPTVWRISMILAGIVALGMMPAFLFNVAIDMWRLDLARLAFHLPAIFSVGVHSVMTHYIPRYNLPLFGIFAIELCMAAYFLRELFISRFGRGEQLAIWPVSQIQQNLCSIPGFDAGWYLAQNPDVAEAKVDPLFHYLNYGASEGRDPSPFFNTKWYLNEYPDVAAAGVNPLIHFVQFGDREGRRPNPLIRAEIQEHSSGAPIYTEREGKGDTFSAFWYGPPLTALHWACLRSFLDHGLALDLYVYTDVEVPYGVRVCDAREIISAKDVYFYPNENLNLPDVGPFSDLFRFKLLELRGGWWIDTDVVCRREPPNCAYGWALEHPGGVFGTSQIKFPKQDVIVQELYRKCSASYTKITRREEIGPVLLTKVLEASPNKPPRHFGDTRTFYPLRWVEGFKLWIPEFAREIQEKANHAYFVTCWASFAGYLGIELNRPPPTGSYLDLLYRRLDIGERLRGPGYSSGEIKAMLRKWIEGKTWARNQLIATTPPSTLACLGLS